MDSDVECVVIPMSVTVIETEAFRDCRNLKKIIFEEGSKLRVIGEGVFEDCISIRSI